VYRSVNRRLSQRLSNRWPAGRWFLVAFTVLALVLQGYATQTHIHPQTNPLSFSAAKADGVASTSGPSKKSDHPSDDDPDNCPLCQLLYGGQFVAPNALVFFLPLLAVSTIETVLGAVPHFDAVSHNWLGRGPPHI